VYATTRHLSGAHRPIGLCAFPNAAFAAQIYDYDNVYDYNAMYKDFSRLSIRRPDSASRNTMLARLLFTPYTTAPQRHMLPSPAGSLNTPPSWTASFSTHSSIPHITIMTRTSHILIILSVSRLSHAALLIKDLKRDLNVLCRLQLYIPRRYSYVIFRSVFSGYVPAPALLVRLCCTYMLCSPRLTLFRFVSIRLFWSCLRVSFPGPDLDASSAVHALPCSDFSRFPFYESCY